MLHKTIARSIRWYKGRVTFESRKQNVDFCWQPRFHDHIIRNEKSHSQIIDYITANPLNWKKDKFYIKDINLSEARQREQIENNCSQSTLP